MSARNMMERLTQVEHYYKDHNVISSIKIL
jgi:hypothetical protein